MNPEQVKSMVRTILATFGGMLAGFFAAKGWFKIEDVTSILNSEAFVGIITSLVVGVWGLITHTNANAVAVVDANPDVAGVIPKSNKAGMDLAAKVSSPTVSVAGTSRARAIAENRL